MGGNTDGSSGPGVGAAAMLVQEAGVGKMIWMVGVAFAEGVVVGVAQDVTKKRKRPIGKSLFI